MSFSYSVGVELIATVGVDNSNRREVTSKIQGREKYKITGQMKKIIRIEMYR